MSAPDSLRRFLEDDRRASILACILLALFILVALTSMVHLSETTDESGYLAMGRRALFGNVHAADMQRTPITALNFLIPWAFGHNWIDTAASLFQARIPTLLCGAILGIYILTWSRRLYGPAGMIVSTVLFAFCPNLLAHARLINSDVYFSLFLFMALFHLVAFLRQGKAWDHLAFSVACGLAVVAKQTSLLLAGIVPVIVIAQRFSSHAPSRFTVSRILTSLFIILLVLNFFYGFNLYRIDLHANVITPPLSHLYLPVPEAYIEAIQLGAAYNQEGWPAYLLGQYSQHGWWYYFPVLLLFKMPLAFLVLLAMRAMPLKIERSGNFIDEFAILSSTAILLLFFCFFCHVDIGVRYVLPILPGLYVLIGKIGACAMERKSARMTAAVSALLLFYMASSLSYYPHFIPYANELIPDRTSLYRYFADSNLDWGQSDYYMRRFVAEQERNNRTVHINPSEPVQGLVVISADTLLDVLARCRNFPPEHAWLLDNFKPVAQVAYNWLVFDTSGATVPASAGQDAPTGN